jgi:hypothetical protein
VALKKSYAASINPDETASSAQNTYILLLHGATRALMSHVVELQGGGQCLESDVVQTRYLRERALVLMPSVVVRGQVHCGRVAMVACIVHTLDRVLPESSQLDDDKYYEEYLCERADMPVHSSTGPRGERCCRRYTWRVEGFRKDV